MATRPSMQKISIAVERIAWDLLCLDVGDRVRSIDEYHNRLGVSSGTVKNALDYLESTGAASFSRHGHEGTIVEHMDYRALQRSCTRGQLLGIMPLPYSVRYEGFATALCEQLSDLDFNMAYARGAESRIALVESSTCHSRSPPGTPRSGASGTAMTSPSPSTADRAASCCAMCWCSAAVRARWSTA